MLGNVILAASCALADSKASANVSSASVSNLSLFCTVENIILGPIIFFSFVPSLIESLSPTVKAEDKTLCSCIQNTLSNVNLKNEIIY